MPWDRPDFPAGTHSYRFNKHNYCRSIRHKDTPWCYVEDDNGNLVSEECDIPQCADCPCGTGGKCVYYRPDVIHCVCDEDHTNHGGKCVSNKTPVVDLCHPGPLSAPDKCTNGQCVYNNTGDTAHLMTYCKCDDNSVYHEATGECVPEDMPNSMGCFSGDDCGEVGKCEYTAAKQLKCVCPNDYHLNADQVCFVKLSV